MYCAAYKAKVKPGSTFSYMRGRKSHEYLCASKFACVRTYARRQHSLLVLRPWVLVRPRFKLLTSGSADWRSPNWADLMATKNNNSEELNHIFFYHNQALLLLHLLTYDNWYRYKTTFVQTYFPYIFRFRGPSIKIFPVEVGPIVNLL